VLIRAMVCAASVAVSLLQRSRQPARGYQRVISVREGTAPARLAVRAAPPSARKA